MIKTLLWLGVLTLALIGPVMAASASVGVGPASVVAQEESPYQPPDFETVEAPDWLAPLAPLGRLPLWGQAAVVSAGVAGLFFALPALARWIWRLGEDHEREAHNGGVGR